MSGRAERSRRRGATGRRPPAADVLARRAVGVRAPRAPRAPVWAAWSDAQLLEQRISDLGLTIEGSALGPAIARLERELGLKKLRFRPFYWLADDWFTPDGVPGIAIPFYMAHPRLARLEQTQMLDVEGGTFEWCMRILRHEAGHAIDNAYRLRRRRERSALFGKSSQRYPQYYVPRPYSTRYVLHLEPWYAQSHPDEDFAETFAVWLNPRSFWRERYAEWPALKKLEYVDALMREIGPSRPVVSARDRIGAVSRLTKTLGDHYRRKRRRYGLDHPNVYDGDLRRLFSDAPEFRGNKNAAGLLVRTRGEVRRTVARWTGEYQYTIDQVFDDLITRCRELNLRLVASEERTKMDFAILLTVQTMNYRHGRRHRVWL